MVPQVPAGGGPCPLPEVPAQSEGQRRALPGTTPRGPRRMGLHTPSQRGSLRPLRPHLFLPASTAPPALGQGRGRAQGCRSLWKTLHPLGLVVYWPMGAAPGAWCPRAPVWAGLDAKVTSGLQRTKPGGARCLLACAGGPVWPHRLQSHGSKAQRCLTVIATVKCRSEAWGPASC